MKQVFTIFALVILCGGAFATGKTPPTPHPNPSAEASAAAQAGATAGATAYGSPSGDTRLYVFPAPGNAAPLPPGFCSVGKSMARGFLWNFYWESSSDTRTDPECMRLLAELERLKAQPMPRQPVALLTEPLPAVKPAACQPPAKAKSVSAAKASGACKS